MTNIPSTVNPIGSPDSRLKNTFTYSEADHTQSTSWFALHDRLYFLLNTPFTRRSKHHANIELT